MAWADQNQWAKPSTLSSPPGVQAPMNAINFTPDTGEITGPGAVAPVDKTNVSLITPANGVPDPAAPSLPAVDAPTDTPAQSFTTGQPSLEQQVADMIAMWTPAQDTFNLEMPALGMGSDVGVGAEGDDPLLPLIKALRSYSELGEKAFPAIISEWEALTPEQRASAGNGAGWSDKAEPQLLHILRGAQAAQPQGSPAPAAVVQEAAEPAAPAAAPGRKPYEGVPVDIIEAHRVAHPEIPESRRAMMTLEEIEKDLKPARVIKSTQATENGGTRIIYDDGTIEDKPGTGTKENKLNTISTPNGGTGIINPDGTVTKVVAGLDNWTPFVTKDGRTMAARTNEAGELITQEISGSVPSHSGATGPYGIHGSMDDISGKFTPFDEGERPRPIAEGGMIFTPPGSSVDTSDIERFRGSLNWLPGQENVGKGSDEDDGALGDNTDGAAPAFGASSGNSWTTPTWTSANQSMPNGDPLGSTVGVGADPLNIPQAGPSMPSSLPGTPMPGTAKGPQQTQAPAPDPNAPAPEAMPGEQPSPMVGASLNKNLGWKTPSWAPKEWTGDPTLGLGADSSNEWDAFLSEHPELRDNPGMMQEPPLPVVEGPTGQMPKNMLQPDVLDPTEGLDRLNTDAAQEQPITMSTPLEQIGGQRLSTPMAQLGPVRMATPLEQIGSQRTTTPKSTEGPTTLNTTTEHPEDLRRGQSPKEPRQPKVMEGSPRTTSEEPVRPDPAAILDELIGSELDPVAAAKAKDAAILQRAEAQRQEVAKNADRIRSRNAPAADDAFHREMTGDVDRGIGMNTPAPVEPAPNASSQEPIAQEPIAQEPAINQPQPKPVNWDAPIDSETAARLHLITQNAQLPPVKLDAVWNELNSPWSRRSTPEITYPEQPVEGPAEKPAAQEPDRNGFQQLLHRLGIGEDTPIDEVGMGADYVPPVPPQDVVGDGNKWMQDVPMEGEHKGTDLQAYEGTPTQSPVDGVVVAVQEKPEGLGLQVLVMDPTTQEVHTMSHLASALVKEGDQVKAGQEVGTVGESGAGATGPHLDYRIQDAQTGDYKNPEPRLGPLAKMPMAANTVGAGSEGDDDESGGGDAQVVADGGTGDFVEGSDGGAISFDTPIAEAVDAPIFDARGTEITPEMRSVWNSVASNPDSEAARSGGRMGITSTIFDNQGDRPLWDPNGTQSLADYARSMGVEVFGDNVSAPGARNASADYGWNINGGTGPASKPTVGNPATSKPAAPAASRASSVAMGKPPTGTALRRGKKYGVMNPWISDLDWTQFAGLNELGVGADEPVQGPPEIAVWEDSPDNPGQQFGGGDPNDPSRWRPTPEPTVPSGPAIGPGDSAPNSWNHPAGQFFDDPNNPGKQFRGGDPNDPANWRSTTTQQAADPSKKPLIGTTKTPSMDWGALVGPQMDLQRQQLQQEWQEFLKNFGLNEAQISGVLNGQPTLAAKELDQAWNMFTKQLDTTVSEAEKQRQHENNLAGTYQQKRQAQLTDKALANPWLAALGGMAPAWKEVGGPGQVPDHALQTLGMNGGGQQPVGGTTTAQAPAAGGPLSAGDISSIYQQVMGSPPPVEHVNAMVSSGTTRDELMQLMNAWGGKVGTGADEPPADDPQVTSGMGMNEQTGEPAPQAAGSPSATSTDPGDSSAPAQAPAPSQNEKAPAQAPMRQSDFLNWVRESWKPSGNNALINAANTMSDQDFLRFIVQNDPDRGKMAQAYLNRAPAVPPVADQGSALPTDAYSNFINSGNLPTWKDFNSWTPFQKAAARTNTEAEGTPWETTSYDLRNKWGNEGGPTATPSQTRLQASMDDPAGQLNSQFNAETFGERAADYWSRMGKNWQTANSAQVAVRA